MHINKTFTVEVCLLPCDCKGIFDLDFMIPSSKAHEGIQVDRNHKLDHKTVKSLGNATIAPGWCWYHTEALQVGMLSVGLSLSGHHNSKTMPQLAW